MITVKRFFSSIIDKVIIVALFVILNLLLSPFGGAREMGAFTGCIGASQITFEYMPDGALYQQIVNKQLLILIVVAVLYYGVCETLLRGSIGKRLLSLKLVDSDNHKIAERGLGLLRAFMRCIIIGAFIAFREASGTSIFIMFFFYMLITKLLVPFIQKSFVDLFTGTMYLNSGDVEFSEGQVTGSCPTAEIAP